MQVLASFDAPSAQLTIKFDNWEDREVFCGETKLIEGVAIYPPTNHCMLPNIKTLIALLTTLHGIKGFPPYSMHSYGSRETSIPNNDNLIIIMMHASDIIIIMSLFIIE